MSNDKLYCVVRWRDASNPRSEEGGFVVRTAYKTPSGDFWLPAPYTNAFQYGRYKSEKRAQASADRLNSQDAANLENKEVRL